MWPFIGISEKSFMLKPSQPSTCVRCQHAHKQPRFSTSRSSKGSFSGRRPPLANLPTLTQHISTLLRFVQEHVSGSFGQGEGSPGLPLWRRTESVQLVTEPHGGPAGGDVEAAPLPPAGPPAGGAASGERQHVLSVFHCRVQLQVPGEDKSA